MVNFDLQAIQLVVTKLHVSTATTAMHAQKINFSNNTILQSHYQMAIRPPRVRQNTIFKTKSRANMIRFNTRYITKTSSRSIDPTVQSQNSSILKRGVLSYDQLSFFGSLKTL